MGTWKGIVGKQFTPEEFRRYVAGLNWGSWRPSFIVLHHTAEPSLAQRPGGFNAASMSGLTRYYRDELGWSAGPHLFVDDQPAGIWVFTPLTTPGVHAKSFNGRSLGLEMLGNYDVEDFDTGRGALVRDNAVAAIAILSNALGVDPDSMMCHRDEPSTSKTCPGNNVDRLAFIRLVKERLAGGAGKAPVAPSSPAPQKAEPTAAPARIIKLTSPYMTGPDVQEVLRLLQKHGYYSGKLDSTYGPRAEAAVYYFQDDNSLEVDGKVGPLTLAVLRR